MLVDVETGALAATHVTRYSNGIIDEALPGGGARLGNAWALQDPADYLSVIYNSIPAVLKESGVSSGNVIGLGMDFTSCTILPVGCDGLPLCFDEKFRPCPHSWVKLWRHHAAQPQANRMRSWHSNGMRSWHSNGMRLF